MSTEGRRESLQSLLGIDLPVIQAPMAGAQGSKMAIAVSNAGGLGSLPCAMLDPDGLRKELAAMKAGTDRPFNVNFFCHRQPSPDAARDAAWREALGPYYKEFGLDLQKVAAGAGRASFSQETLDILAEFAPRVDAYFFSTSLFAIFSDQIRSSVLTTSSGTPFGTKMPK